MSRAELEAELERIERERDDLELVYENIFYGEWSDKANRKWQELTARRSQILGELYGN